MRFIINDFDIYYEKFGYGKKSLLILPGWGDNRITFKYLISYFKDYFTIYILDYPGFGESKFPNRDLSLDDYTRLIIDFMNFNNIDNPVIIAHSFGGRIAINLANNDKVSISKLIMIDAAGIKPKKSLKQKFRQLLYKFLKKISILFRKNTKNKYLSFLIKLFGSADYKNLTPNMRNTFIKIVNTDLRSALSNIDTETLLIWGENDIDTPIKDAYLMKREIKDSGLVIIKGAHHFSYLQYPGYINLIIEQFIKSDKRKDT